MSTLPCTDRGEEPHRLGDPDLVRQCGVLQLAADAPPDLGHLAARVEPEHRDLPGVGVPQSLQALDSCGLAGAVGSEDAEDLPSRDVERDVPDGAHGPVGLAQATYPDVGH